MKPHSNVMIDISEFTVRPMSTRFNVSPRACSLVREHIGLLSKYGMDTAWFEVLNIIFALTHSECIV